MHLPHESAVSFLGIYTREIKTCSCENLYADVYGGFIYKYKNGKQLKCLSIGKWIKWGWEWWGEGKEEKTRPDPVVQPYYGIRILSNKNNKKKKT